MVAGRLSGTVSPFRAEQIFSVASEEASRAGSSLERLNILLAGMLPFREEKLSFLLMLLPVFALPEGRTVREYYSRVNIMIGGLTPPFGSMMFTVCGITGCQISDFLKEIWPYILALVIVLILCTYFPILITIVPDLMYG